MEIPNGSYLDSPVIWKASPRQATRAGRGVPCRARARERVVPISELVFGALTQNRNSLEPSLGFAAIAGTLRIENGGTLAVDFPDGRRDRDNIDVRPDAPQPFGVPHRLFRGMQHARHRVVRLPAVMHDDAGHRTTGCRASRRCDKRSKRTDQTRVPQADPRAESDS
jgi:hypothetical protein